MRWTLAALVTSVLVACGGVCPHSAPIAGLDGGTVGCLIPDTCPRAGTQLVCTNVSDLRESCIACQQNTCQLLTPGACP